MIHGVPAEGRAPASPDSEMETLQNGTEAKSGMLVAKSTVIVFCPQGYGDVCTMLLAVIIGG